MVSRRKTLKVHSAVARSSQIPLYAKNGSKQFSIWPGVFYQVALHRQVGQNGEFCIAACMRVNKCCSLVLLTEARNAPTPAEVLPSDSHAKTATEAERRWEATQKELF